MKNKKETRGRKLLYGEPTVMITYRVPLSYKKRICKSIEIQLLKLQKD